MRLDKYLKISRIIKRRTVANEACDNGRVTLNGRVARASAEGKPGDIIVIAFGNRQTKEALLIDPSDGADRIIGFLTEKEYLRKPPDKGRGPRSAGERAQGSGSRYVPLSSGR